ncbi:type IX secretion system outer membrane channel protein PorV [Pedobacter changchengzhani]|uniref:Type IX secretion system outer membrane channel protein PorV n=1 Tax=Pedobacter changchengzhani TaxID=2529274 RepID=A0A4R5MPU7_9SPHI|nr:type IX secretion system outer membrane channel protein PorV [Pedobacter changchengzhani]TDG37887.1 type IX secretion system outer membrane channel protein PorV [Pedobacter changchengzhani]
MSLSPYIRFFWCSALLLFTVGNLQAQVQTNGSEANNIITAVPFLLITPDARAGSMGNAGVAVAGDANSSSINVAKLAYLKDDYGFGISYSPWLKNLVPDINLAYLSGYYKLDDRNTIASSLRYFSLGNIQLTDENQQSLGVFNPNEFAFDASFVRSFGEEFALGTTLRFIYSNLGSNLVSSGQQSSPGKAVAADVSGIYNSSVRLFNTDALVSVGANISNIGTKMSYSSGGTSYFLPTNLKLGGATSFNFDGNSEITVALDFNKLLVPTQPIYDNNGNIVSGKDPNRSVPAGIFGSFSDAPGGFNEELKEVGLSTGVEYIYDKQFALRAGYQYQNPAKGDARYFTLGAGFKYNVLNLDLSYLIANAQTSPLANTLRFSLLFNFGRTKAEDRKLGRD